LKEKQYPGAILDIEYYLPSQVITNSDLGEKYPEWRVDHVEKKTGVFERRIAGENETAYDLALCATKRLLDKHPLLRGKIDAIIFCTQSPDYVMPSNAFLLHRDLGLGNNVLAFDYNLACSGYIYGLLIASGLIKVGIVRNILLVTADTYSKYIADSDRSTRMLFGDGASVTWIGEVCDTNPRPIISSFDNFSCASDGSGWDKFIIKSGASRMKISSEAQESLGNKIHMDGLQILNLVNGRVLNQIRELLIKSEINVEQVDQFLFHQASGLALDSIAKKMKIPQGKMFTNIKNIGNTVSSSLPILIKDFFSEKDTPKDSKLFLCGFGVGYSWGSLLVTT